MNRLAFVLPALLALTTLTVGCECEGERPRRDLDAGARHDARASGDGFVVVEPVVSLEIDPSVAETTVRNGVAETVRFTATGVREDGSRTTGLAATWTVDHSEIGSFGLPGEFTPRGELGGVVTITAEVVGLEGPLRASATLTVHIETLVAGSVPAESAGRIDSASPGTETAPSVVYPLDRVTMPQNVFAPDVQWTPTGVVGDVFRVRLSKPHVQLTGLVAPSSSDPLAHHFLSEPAAWRALTDSDLASPITLEVTRWNSATATLSAAHTLQIQISPGAIAGAVYYWQVTGPGGGRVNRILPGAGTNDEVAGAGTCIACHTVSRDGRYLAGGEFDESSGIVMDLTTTPPSVVFSRRTLHFTFATFSPDSRRLLVNRLADDLTDPRTFALVDPLTGLEVPSTGLPTGFVAQPEWSPDGASVAYVGNLDSSYERTVVYESGDLSIMPVVGADAFGTPRVVHTGSSLAGAPEGGASDMHPTWSPDSRLLAFAHGTIGRATSGLSSITNYYPGALYLVTAGGGAPMRLDNANGGAGGTASYWPTFSPFATPAPSGTGRVFWLAYFSPRAYGNHPAASSPPPSQLWVTAINVDAASGDPSHVPYWLPGQDPTRHNIDAHWTALACRTNGDACASASECCSGVCLSPGGGAPSVCGPPPPSMCRSEGASCGGTEDCCDELVCVANACVTDLI